MKKVVRIIARLNIFFWGGVTTYIIYRVTC